MVGRIIFRLRTDKPLFDPQNKSLTEKPKKLLINSLHKTDLKPSVDTRASMQEMLLLLMGWAVCCNYNLYVSNCWALCACLPTQCTRTSYNFIRISNENDCIMDGLFYKSIRCEPHNGIRSTFCKKFDVAVNNAANAFRRNYPKCSRIMFKDSAYYFHT